MNSFTQQLLETISINIELYKASEKRDQKLILALGILVYVSSCIGGYAASSCTLYLLNDETVAMLLGIFTTIFLVIHDSSLMATDKIHQVVIKLIVSVFLAVAFTLTNNATKEYDTLRAQLVQEVKIHNASVQADLNNRIEEISKEERDIMQRIEEAGKQINITKQPLIDARRSLAAFQNSKEERIKRIKETFSPLFREAQISDLNILTQQAKNFTSIGEGTLIAFLLALCFLFLEALPVILRLMLGSSDYMIRYIASLNVMRDLRDIRIEEQRNFVSRDANILNCCLQMEIIDKKNDVIKNNFTDTSEILILDDMLKTLNAGINPYTGKPLDYVDMGAYSDHETSHPPNQENEQPPRTSNNTNGKDEIFNLSNIKP